MRLKDVKPGTRIKITQASYSPSRPNREFTIEAKFLGFKVSDTGAPFAHSKTGHYQMFRVRIEKNDGEISEMNIDRLTRIRIIA